MTEKDILALLAINQTTFPYAYKDMSLDDRKALTRIWFSLFENYSFAVIKHAFHMCLKVCKMPVTPADIFQQLNKMEQAQGVTDEELWERFVNATEDVYSLSQYFGYSFKDETGMTQSERARERCREIFNDLDKEIKVFCGSVYNLIDYGKQGRAELNKYLKPQFMKRISTLKERAKILDETPDEILQLTEQTTAKLSMRNVLQIKEEN